MLWLRREILESISKHPQAGNPAGGYPRVAHQSGDWPCEVDLNPLAADLKNRPPATLQGRSVYIQLLAWFHLTR